MARPIRIDYGSTGIKPWIKLNYHITPFSVAFETEGGTVTVETTLDDVDDPAITPVATAATSPLTSPVVAIRCNVTLGTTTFKLLQAGVK